MDGQRLPVEPAGDSAMYMLRVHEHYGENKTELKTPGYQGDVRLSENSTASYEGEQVTVTLTNSKQLTLGVQATGPLDKWMLTLAGWTVGINFQYQWQQGSSQTRLLPPLRHHETCWLVGRSMVWIVEGDADLYDGDGHLGRQWYIFTEPREPRFTTMWQTMYDGDAYWINI